MAEDKVRLSQVVGVFGPGAMLDLSRNAQCSFKGSITGRCLGQARFMSSRSHASHGFFISVLRMMDGSLPTGRLNYGHRRLMLGIQSANHPA
jgi:hypothetical protein